MNYNSENYGFEQIKANNKILKNDKAIEFSKKILNAIKAKVKEHNATSVKKITFAQLKKVYKNNIHALDSEKNFNQVAFARVNMFLRMVTWAVSDKDSSVFVFFLALTTDEEMLFSVSSNTPKT